MTSDHALPPVLTSSAPGTTPAPSPTPTPSAITSRGQGRDDLGMLATAVAVGVLLGVVDLWWNLHHPSAWSTVANSCAGWAACAFVLGAALRVDALRAAVAGVVMLAVAVEAYYAAEVVLQAGDRSILTGPVAMEWLVLAGVAGAIFGPAGAWAAGRSSVLAVVGLAVGVALLLGDAWHLAGRDPLLGGEPRVLVLLALVMLAASLRRPVVAVAALALSLPLSLVVAGVFTSAGVFM